MIYTMPIQSQGLTNKQNLGSCSMPSMDISGFGKNGDPEHVVHYI